MTGIYFGKWIGTTSLRTTSPTVSVKAGRPHAVIIQYVLDVLNNINRLVGHSIGT